MKSGLEEFEVPIVNKPLTNWWSMEDDRSLLIGVYRYGFGTYDEIRVDPELSFHLHEKEMEAAEKKKQHEPTVSEGMIIEEDEKEKEKEKEKDIDNEEKEKRDKRQKRKK